jgi:hypothetical protein
MIKITEILTPIINKLENNFSCAHDVKFKLAEYSVEVSEKDKSTSYVYCVFKEDIEKSYKKVCAVIIFVDNFTNFCILSTIAYDQTMREIITFYEKGYIHPLNGRYTLPDNYDEYQCVDITPWGSILLNEKEFLWAVTQEY